MEKKMYADALAEAQKTIELGGDSPVNQAAIGMIYARMGRRDEALAILKQLEEGVKSYSPTLVCPLYDDLGMRDKAFALLEKAYAEREDNWQYIGADPVFDSLRSDPRFQDLLRRVGLPQ